MLSIKSLVDELTHIERSRIVSQGYGVWLCWTGDLSEAVVQTLRDHGGLELVHAGGQSLWWFSTREVFRATAKLQIWSRLNPVSLFLQVFPSPLLIGWKLDHSMSMASDIEEQAIDPPNEFEVYIHPKLKDVAKQIPGLELKKGEKTIKGTPNVEWLTVWADPSFSYDSNLGWFFIIRPLGNPTDRDFVLGWRYFISTLEPLLQRFGVKYIQNESALILPLENLRQLQTWCREVINLVQVIKDSEEGKYWPCVMVAPDRGNLNFNPDLPNKLRLDWNRLTPDYPHLGYRSAFLMGNDFIINEVGYFSESLGIDNWCYISQSTDMAEMGDSTSLDINMSKRLLVGAEKECFYCGLKNHVPADCPSREILEFTPTALEKLNSINLGDINAITGEIDEALSGDEPLEVLEKMLLSGTDRASTLVRAIFENTAHCQQRMLRMLWRSRSKDWDGAFVGLAPEEGEYIWAALESMRLQDYSNCENLIGQALVRYPRSYQPRSLQGFLYMENGDWDQAFFYWQEAERLSYTGVQRAVLFNLQGRCQEIMAEFQQAIGIYKQAHQNAPDWVDPLYRQGVCLVKMGFTEQALSIFRDCIEKDATYFNRILLDPELDRGRFSILAFLGNIWNEAQERTEKSRKKAEELNEQVALWFADDHEYSEIGRKKVAALMELTKVENYVAYQKLNEGVPVLNREFKQKVESEIRVFEQKVDSLYERLREVQREASWFPFPKLLVEFNRDFNYCAQKINWMKTSPLQMADNFRKSQEYLVEVENRLVQLQNRLITLRIVRDSTFFILMLGKNFIWMELIGLGLALVLVPCIVYLAEKYWGGWVADLVLKQKWQLQKGLILVLSITALAAATLKTAILFERKKEQLFTEEYEKAKRMVVEARLKQKQAVEARRARIKAIAEQKAARKAQK